VFKTNDLAHGFFEKSIEAVLNTLREATARNIYIDISWVFREAKAHTTRMEAFDRKFLASLSVPDSEARARQIAETKRDEAAVEQWGKDVFIGLMAEVESEEKPLSPEEEDTIANEVIRQLRRSRVQLDKIRDREELGTWRYSWGN